MPSASAGTLVVMTDDAGSDATTWREMAVARSLDPARERAEKRVERFLDGALELMVRSPDREFTVQEVVEQSGQSLRSFYQYFAGKHELMLALFEEAVTEAAEQMEKAVADIDDPLERLHVFTRRYYRMCRPQPAGAAELGEQGSSRTSAAWVMADFAQQLLTKHPGAAARAFAPLSSRYQALLDETAEAGAIRSGLDHQRITGVVLQSVMFNSFADTIGGSAVGDVDPSAEWLWELLLNGLGADPG